MNICVTALLIGIPFVSFCMNTDKAYIKLPKERFGISALFAVSPETEAPIRKLVQMVLRERASATFSSGDRELIAAYVSYLNQCDFCYKSHGAVATCLLEDGNIIVNSVIKDISTAPISDKMKALLHIAKKVKKGGHAVTPEDIKRAKSCGANDIEIHDTVLITAIFCMNNRYVLGLNAPTPTDSAFYETKGKILANQGYI